MRQRLCGEEDEFKDLNGPVSCSIKFGDYLSKLNNKSHLKPIYFDIKNETNITIYILIFVTNNLTSYNHIYHIFEMNSSYLHMNDNRFEYSLCVTKEKSIDLNKNYLVEDILDTKILNGKRLWKIKWKNKRKNSWETNEITRFNRKILEKFKKLNLKKMTIDNDIYDAEESNSEIEEFIDKKMKVETILGATTHPDSNELLFLVKIKNSFKKVWLDRSTAHCKCPQKVLIIKSLFLLLNKNY